MREQKKEKMSGILQQLAAEFIRDEATSASLLTVTRVEISPSGKDARIYFTTLPESKEDTALKFLERKSLEFKHYVYEKGRIGTVPHLSFKIDYGERNRQRIDILSNGLAEEEKQ
jgi:ribosome-binding factor A